MILQAKEIIENANEKIGNVVSWTPDDPTKPTTAYCSN
jgi:hypothetical protein